MAYLNLNLELLNLKTNDDQLKELQNKTEKHDHENILNSLKLDNESYRKKYKSLNKKKVLLAITEILISSALTNYSSTMGFINPGACIFISSSSALLTSIAILITNEYILKLKIRYNRLRDSKIVITLLFEKTLKISLVDKKSDQKEAEELKKSYNQYIDERKEIMKNFIFRVEDVFGDVITKDNFSQEQVTKLDNLLAKILSK